MIDRLIPVSQRNVVFFRNQEITIEEQKELGRRLGELSGKPATSGLHIHPLTPEFSQLGDHVTVISSERTKVYKGQDDISTLSSLTTMLSVNWGQFTE
jgi:alpha-ketoglutarate-dependent taurine dioxygenase